MEELYVNINELVQDLLIPARVEKKINKEAFENFIIYWWSWKIKLKERNIYLEKLRDYYISFLLLYPLKRQI